MSAGAKVPSTRNRSTGRLSRVFLTLTSTAAHASDLGFLLHKHPDRVQTFDLSVGTAHVFYPESNDERCTAALLLEVDPIALVRSKRFGGDPFALAQYVNDRPYAASSLLAVALGQVFGTAMKGRCPARPDLEGAALPLKIHVPAVPVRGDAGLAGRLFAPLGWDVDASSIELDPEVPRWGDSPYVDLTLTGTMPLNDALSHLYVLLPVLDGAKHYWVAADEVDKLVRTGGGWLHDHPEREFITHRYLAHQGSYVADATARLAELDESPCDGDVVGDKGETTRERPRPLLQQRKAAVLSALRDVGARRIVDLGCGEGALLRDLLADPTFTEVVGVDVSARELDRAAKRLALDRMPDSQRARLTLRQSSVTYRDRAVRGYDAIVLMEVIEHLDLDRLPSLERNVFAAARPGAVVVTTPNADYNRLYDSLPANRTRHPDHRFEWTRHQFGAWADRVAAEHGYVVEQRPVGAVDPDHGAPTQLALFTRNGASGGEAR